MPNNAIRVPWQALTVVAVLSAAGAPALARAEDPPAQADAVGREVSAAECRRLVDALAAFGTRHTLSDTESATRGIGASRRWIKSELEKSAAHSGGRMTVAFEEWDVPPGVRVPNGAKIVNVVARLPGTMPESAGRLYYVVGHYDSRASDPLDATADAPGANDNASGTAVVMELARVLAAHPLESTVVFLCTSGEEQGLLGAKAHADAAKARAERVMAVLNNDIVGDPYGPGPRDPSSKDRSIVRVFSEGLGRNLAAEQLAQVRSIGAEVDSPSRQLARFIRDVGAAEHAPVQPKVIYRLDRFLRGGDHTPFSEAGFAAVRFTAPREDYARQHQDVRIAKDAAGRMVSFGDVPEAVDADYLADVARLNVMVLVHLANAPNPPQDVRIVTAELSNSTLVRWSASPEPDVAGYEVVWRETTSPYWDHAVDAGNATQTTLDVPKDDCLFGVRAYDRDGNRSPVTFAGAAAK